MTDDVTGSGDGTFVIAGMRFREGAPELTTWDSGRVAAVAPIDITIDTGITVTVDVAEPSRILHLQVADFGDPEALISACEDGSTVGVDEILSGGGTNEIELTLRSAWARKALVAGISRWMPRPLHEGGLLLDEAAARQAVGESLAAAQLVALAAPVLEALSLDCEDGFLSAATLVVVKDVSARAVEAVGGLDWGTEIAEWNERITSATAWSTDALMSALEQWSMEHEPALAAAASIAGDESEDDDLDAPTSDSYQIDPAAVTARIAQWVDAEHAEVRVELTTAADGTIADFEVQLSEFVDAHCYEVGRVVAFVADGASGNVLRTAGTRVSGHRLRARLHYETPPSGRTVFGVYDADRGVTAVRSREADRHIIGVDRLLLNAWSTHRAALVAQMHLGASDDATRAEVAPSIERFLEEARSLARQARGKLSSRRATAAAAAARLTAIDNLLARLDLEGVVAQEGCEPLLAELLPLSPAI